MILLFIVILRMKLLLLYINYEVINKVCKSRKTGGNIVKTKTGKVK